MKILVTYASIGGNTMMVAQKIQEVLSANGHTEVDVIDMDQLEPAKLSQYPVVFIGSSTWGDGEYNDFSQVFFDKVKNTEFDLSSTKFAIFGLGESFYPVFCNVVELMKTDLANKKANIIGEPMKIDGFPDDTVMEKVTQWVVEMLKLV